MPLGAARAVLVSGTAAGGGGAVVTPAILGTVTTDINSVIGHATDPATHTVTAGTEALLAVTMYGPVNTAGGGTEVAPSSNLDGNFTVIQAANLIDGTGFASNPRIGLWILRNPTAGAHTITRSITGDTLNYSALALINLDDTQVADDVGASQAVKQPVDAATFSVNLTTEKTISRIIAAAAWQDGTLTITANEGLTELVEIATGAGSANDGVLSVATKVGPVTPGVTAYGFTCSASEDHAYAAVEIRGAG